MTKTEAKQKAYQMSNAIAMHIKEFTLFLDEHHELFETSVEKNHFTHIELQHYGQRFFDMGEVFNKQEVDSE